jgi:aminoglycoside phosphotransferase family enzyme/predicted kinase
VSDEGCALAGLRALVASVADALCARSGHERNGQRILETHISVLLLSGDIALKFKKPVDLGFVDFTTLEKRRQLCHEEWRLNRRFAPTLYQQVVAVVIGEDGEPRLVARQAGQGSAGVEREYAVQMRRFAHEEMLDVRVEAGSVSAEEISGLVDDIVAFQQRSAAADAGSGAGSPSLVRQQVLGSLEHITDLDDEIPVLLRNELDALADVFATRCSEGFIRDGHGDLHLSNIVQLEGRPTPFDCIEFNSTLRVIDTVSDFAFLLMDLDFRGCSELANIAFNRYFDRSGDFDGLAVLRLYLAYRSLVRAKVASLQAGDDTVAASQRDRLGRRRARHVALAREYLAPAGKPALWITHGFSGSGKSHHCRRIAARSGWLHVRSDVERKRLLGVAADEATGSGLGEGAYAESVTEQTYARLARIARTAVSSGFSVIVDASFLSLRQRRLFRALASDLGVAWRILDCDAEDAVLRERIRNRAAGGTDPSEADEAVLTHQQRTHEPLDEDERRVSQSPAAVLNAAADFGNRAPPQGRERPGCRFADAP